MERKESECPDTPERRQGPPSQKRDRAEKIQSAGHGRRLDRQSSRHSRRPQHHRNGKSHPLSRKHPRTNSVTGGFGYRIVSHQRIDVRGATEFPQAVDPPHFTQHKPTDHQ